MINQNPNLKRNFFGSILIIGLVWAIYHTYYFELELSELKEVKGVLSKDPNFKSNRHVNSLELVIYEDNWRYLATGNSYEVLDVNGVKEDLKKGQQITLLISQVTGINELLDQIVGVVDFYELRSNGKTYLKLEDYNSELKNNRFTFIFIWLFFFISYIYKFWFKDKIRFRNK